jgi:hypothetical protein
LPLGGVAQIFGGSGFLARRTGFPQGAIFAPAILVKAEGAGTGAGDRMPIAGEVWGAGGIGAADTVRIVFTWAEWLHQDAVSMPARKVLHADQEIVEGQPMVPGTPAASSRSAIHCCRSE